MDLTPSLYVRRPGKQVSLSSTRPLARRLPVVSCAPLAPDCGLEFSSSLGRPVASLENVTPKWHSETCSSLCCIMPTPQNDGPSAALFSIPAWKKQAQSHLPCAWIPQFTIPSQGDVYSRLRWSLSLQFVRSLDGDHLGLFLVVKLLLRQSPFLTPFTAAPSISPWLHNEDWHSSFLLIIYILVFVCTLFVFSLRTFF